MNKLCMIPESCPTEYFTFEGSIIYKGRLINLFLDDYGQCWHIQYEKDGELIDENCGTYCEWREYVEWRFKDE